MKARALLLALLLPAAAGARPGILDVRGNEALPDGVYLAVLKPPSGPPTMEAVEALAEQGERFLHEAGYTLATVDGHIEGESIVLTINEGLLDRVVFRGRLTFQMLRLKLALDLPHEVFNKPHLEQQLAALAAQLGIPAPSWELVPSQVVPHLGPQVDTLGPLGTIKGATLVRPRQKYELQVFFAEKDWNTGFGLDVRSNFFDGLELGANYQGRTLFFRDDRWRVALSGGVGIRTAIGSTFFYPFPSRGFAEAQYYTPPFAKVVRSFVWLRHETIARQRVDLRLENFVSLTSELSANIQVRPLELLNLSVGFGAQHYFLTGERAPVGDPVLLPHDEMRWRGFVRLGVDLLFDVPNARWDRRHGLELEGRLFNDLLNFDKVTMGELRLSYQKVFAFGWHDLWIKSRGVWLNGDVLYPFEEPLGEHLRASFADIYPRAVISGKGEFRFSLTRDLFKLGVFVDGAVYGVNDPTSGARLVRGGMAFGPSFHALIEGMFQLDMAVSFALLSTGRFNTALYARVVKVF